MRVLIVDDEPIALLSLRYLLESAGIESDLFARSEIALELFRHHPDRFDAIVTDLAMPGMRGNELAEEIWQSRPDFPVTILSGMPNDGAISAPRRGRSLCVLSKPAELREILRSFRKMGLKIPSAGIAA